MNAPGKGMLKVSGILLIVFGSLGIIIYGFSLVATALANSLANSNLPGMDVPGFGAALGLLNTSVPLMIVSLISAVLALVFGIIGLMKCADPAKANLFIVMGVILCALAVVSAVMSFNILSLLLSCVLPILFIVGGSMNKKATAAPSAQA